MKHWEPFSSEPPLTCERAEKIIERLESDAFKRGLVTEPVSSVHAEPIKSRPAVKRKRQFIKSQNATHDRPMILLIDDDEPFRKMLKRFLEKTGYDVVEAADGSIGVTLYHEAPADLVITDIIMPEKDGLETIIEIKENFPDVKTIAISGGGSYGSDIDLDMARKLGARTLDKPFELNTLLTVIREMLA